MKGWSLRSRWIVLASVLVQQGCLFKKTPPKASIVIPPAPQAQPPQPLPTPPQLAAPPQSTPNVRAAQIPTLPPDLPPPEVPVKTAKPKPTRKGPVAITPPIESPGTAQPDVPAHTVPLPTPGPSLQPILGSKEIEERNQRIQTFLDKARLIVLRAERSAQSEQQKQLIAQVRTFLQQAEDARKVDLVRAENLAERAEVLSRGLSQ